MASKKNTDPRTKKQAKADQQAREKRSLVRPTPIEAATIKRGMHADLVVMFQRYVQTYNLTQGYAVSAIANQARQLELQCEFDNGYQMAMVTAIRVVDKKSKRKPR